MEAAAVIVTPTTYATILGGAEGENEWGDPVEGDTELYTRVPCALHEQPRHTTSDEGQREPVTIIFVTGYIPRRYEVTGANRLRDERTGDIYLIDKVTRPQHPSMPQDTRLDLRRVS
jgi:hypothetical protein